MIQHCLWNFGLRLWFFVEDFIETYDMIASKRGALSRGGVADYEKVSGIIVKDLKNGYFGKITLDRLK